MSKFFRFILLTATLIFTSCVNNLNDESEVAPLEVLYPATQVILQLDHSEIAFPKKTFARGQGGTPPFSFSILSGEATVNATTGEIQTINNYKGLVRVRVTDSVGLTDEKTFDAFETLTIDPLNSVKYTEQEVTLTANGGKPPYRFHISQGGTSFISSTDSTITLKMASYGDSVLVTSYDSLENQIAATILVIEKLAVQLSKDSYPSQNSDGSANKIYFDIIGGKPNISDEFTVNIVRGLGSVHRVNQRKYYFEPALTKKQTGFNSVQLEVIDDLGDLVLLDFEVFVPMKVTVGGLHSCAVENSDDVGLLKCWGDGLKGQLGQGNDPSSQPYWGDCTNCNEDSKVSTTNTDNFKTVHLLSLSERLAGGTIISYSTGEDRICAVISKDATGLSRDLRCLGDSYAYNYHGRQENLNVGIGEHPYANNGNIFRHPRLNIDSNSGAHYFNQHSFFYRVPKVYSPYYASNPVFPRTFLPLPTSGVSYAISASNMTQFGDTVTTDLNGETYQDPSAFNYFTSYLSGWMPEKVFMKPMTMSESGTFYIVNNIGQFKGRYSSTYNQSSPFASGSWNNNGYLNNDMGGVLKIDFTDYTYDDNCYLGLNNKIYCNSSYPGRCGNDHSLAFGNCNINGIFEPVTTKLGGDSDTAFDVTLLGFGCGIFDGNPDTNISDRLVACWGDNNKYFGNGSTAEQRYAKPVLKTDNSPLIGATKVLNRTIACALVPTNPIGEQLYCWGNADNRRMTSAYSGIQNKAVPINLGANENVLDFSISKYGGTCAITENTISLVKTLKCWGTTANYGYSIPKPVPGPYTMDTTSFNISTTNPSSVQLADSYGCMLAGNNLWLRCWGDNRRAVFGINNGVLGNNPGEMNIVQL